MAWWLSRSYSYAGPGFDWVDSEAVEEERGLYALGLSISRPLHQRNIPAQARYRKAYPKPPAPDLFFVNSAVAVTRRFKDLVEEFESGLHLFAPIELLYHDGRVMEGEYYFFNCNVDVDCVLTDNKKEWFETLRDGRIISAMPYMLDPAVPLPLSKPQIEGRHLWTGGPLGWNHLFVSDAFCAALRKGRFREFCIERECCEVDRPWVAEKHMGPLLDKWRAYVAADRNCEMGYL